MAANDFDVQAAIAALASIVRAALQPGTLNEVFDDIPNLQSTRAPVMFFDYRNGTNQRDAYRGFRRVWYVDCVALLALVQDVRLTDKAIKSFIGTFYNLIATNNTLGGMATEATIVQDESVNFPILGTGNQAINYGAVIFRLEVAQEIAAGGEC